MAHPQFMGLLGAASGLPLKLCWSEYLIYRAPSAAAVRQTIALRRLAGWIKAAENFHGYW